MGRKRPQRGRQTRRKTTPRKAPATTTAVANAEAQPAVTEQPAPPNALASTFVDRWMSIPEICQFLGITDKTLRTWRQRGIIELRSPGGFGRPGMLLSELLAFVRESPVAVPD
ncbi:MAG: helix-turn-helix domain-containing protein [Planctomycetota bacterium]